MIVERRTIIKGLVALVAAPAIVKVGSLMPVNASLQPRLVVVTQRHVDVAYSQNLLVQEYEREFGVEGAKIGTQLRIRLPVDYVTSDGPGLSLLNDPAERYVIMRIRRSDAVYGLLERQRQINDERDVIKAVTPLALAAAAVAAAPQMLAQPVTRRFWSRS